MAKIDKDWCLRMARQEGDAEIGAGRLALEMESAMAPRENPKHPMFRNHNCSGCGSGERPCKKGNPSNCDWPRARND